MRLRRLIKRLGAIFGTIALGGLLGFLVPTVASEYSPSRSASTATSAVSTTNAELPIARAFINAFVSNDQAALKALGADEMDAVKANDLSLAASKVTAPVLLGSVGAPGASLQAYASNVTMKDGTVTVLSWRVLTTSGRPKLIPPPDALNPQP
jgi:hypothetical protein